MQLGHRCKLTAAGLRIHIGPVFQQKASGEDTNPDCRQKQRLPALSWKDLMLQLTLKKKTMIRQKKHLVSFRIEKSYSTRNDPKTLKFQWIGFRANLNGKLQKPWSMVFTSKHRSFHFRFSLERFEQSQCPKIRQGNVRIQRDVNPWLDCYVISDVY